MKTRSKAELAEYRAKLQREYKAAQAVRDGSKMALCLIELEALNQYEART